MGAGFEYSTSESMAFHLGVEHAWANYDFGTGSESVDEREFLRAGGRDAQLCALEVPASCLSATRSELRGSGC